MAIGAFLEQRKMREEIDKLLEMNSRQLKINENLLSLTEDLSKRIAVLELKRGPGRPRNDK